MANFFFPCVGKKPASLVINGHKLLLLSRERGVAEETLSLVGANRVKKVKVGESAEEEAYVLNQLARSARCGVVVAPSEVELDEVIKNLESQLPWIQ